LSGRLARSRRSRANRRTAAASSTLGNSTSTRIAALVARCFLTLAVVSVTNPPSPVSGNKHGDVSGNTPTDPARSCASRISRINRPMLPQVGPDRADLLAPLAS
jgi:hypothetical protein